MDTLGQALLSKIASPQKQLTISLNSIPKDFGMGRLRNDYLIFDNLSDDLKLPDNKEVTFPIKSDAMMTVVLLQGTVRLMINLEELEVKGGQVLTVMPGSIFEARYTSEDTRLFCILINSEFTDEIIKSLGLHIDLTQRYNNHALHTLTKETLENGLTMYTLIKNELAQPDYLYKKEVIQRYCEIWILKNLSRNEGMEKTGLSKPLNRREQIFHDFLSLLEKYYKEERSISFYASQMCLTPKYLSTIIKEVSGKHGMQWIDDFVCLEAKALLRDGTLSVKQVSDQLHFPSQSMFGRFFKKMTGYSPKQYKLL